jgi:aminoglycoside/choline kinase family phosphotransferase
MSDLKQRLMEFLLANRQRLEVEQLTPDASTREYFRIDWNGRLAIACVYPEAFVASEQTYLDVSALFITNGLPVAEVYSFDEEFGVIVQEDLGDTILRDVLVRSTDVERDQLLDDCIRLIARIQAATASAFEMRSVASKLKFDEEKLIWELNFFREHYFETLRKVKLSDPIISSLGREFKELSAELELRATVLCHRDFHAANLMIDRGGRLRIIDHQDARMGSPTYDLVSLLLDRVTQLPAPDWLDAKRSLLLNEREALGLNRIDKEEFRNEFRLQTIQRCLKAVGTFSFQSVNRGKTYFVPFIRPMFEIVRRTLTNLGRFPVLSEVIEAELNGS